MKTSHEIILQLYADTLRIHEKPTNLARAIHECVLATEEVNLGDEYLLGWAIADSVEATSFPFVHSFEANPELLRNLRENIITAILKIKQINRNTFDNAAYIAVKTAEAQYEHDRMSYVWHYFDLATNGKFLPYYEEEPE